MIQELFSLEQGEAHKEEVLENVRQDVKFIGPSLWMLIGAIVIASVGLNVNSTAVVIGAMLISPLMGPIVGAGFALGTFDFALLRKSLLNLLLCTLIGICVSALYFWLSPYKEAQSEILSRTSPNLYDVLIAFFGGLVGVIAITRKQRGNPIPGVAIATALMPPLCTVGYGIATGQWEFSAGAMFLYTINCVFICVSTYIIVRLLKYPIFSFVNKGQKKKVQSLMIALILAVAIPSAYFAVDFIKKERTESKINEFLDKEFTKDGYTILYKYIEMQSDSAQVNIALLRGKLPTAVVREKQKAMQSFGLKKVALNIISPKEVALTEETFDQKNKNAVPAPIPDPSIIASVSNMDSKIVEEFKTLFPEKSKVKIWKEIGENRNYNIQYSSPKFDSINTKNIRNWLKMRLETDSIFIQEVIIRKKNK